MQRPEPATPSRGRRAEAPDEGRCHADPHCTRGGHGGRTHQHHDHNELDARQYSGLGYHRAFGNRLDHQRQAGNPRRRGTDREQLVDGCGAVDVQRATHSRRGNLDYRIGCFVVDVNGTGHDVDDRSAGDHAD